MTSSPLTTKIMNDNRDEYLPRVVERGGGISSRDDDDNDDITIVYPPAASAAAGYPTQYLSKFVIGTSDIQSHLLETTTEQYCPRRTTTNNVDDDRNVLLIRQSLERRKIFRGTSSLPSSSSVRMTNTNKNSTEDVRDYKLHPLRSISEDTTITSNNTRKYNDINGSSSNKSHFLDYWHEESASSTMFTSGSSNKNKSEIVSNITEKTKSTKTTSGGGGRRKEPISAIPSVAMKILCSKILEGYTLTRQHCPVCKMAKVTSSSSSSNNDKAAECAYCPIGQYRTTITEAVHQRIEAIADLTSLALSSRCTGKGLRVDPPSVGEYTNDDDNNNNNNGNTGTIYCNECLSPKCSSTTDVECKVCSITNDICIKISQEQGKGGILLTDRTCLECGNPEMCNTNGVTNCIVCEILLMKVGNVPRRSSIITESNNDDTTHVIPPPIEESQPEEEEEKDEEKEKEEKEKKEKEEKEEEEGGGGGGGEEQPIIN
jgi:uncharacterized Zn finger protein (UPF0148 family)